MVLLKCAGLQRQPENPVGGKQFMYRRITQAANTRSLILANASRGTKDSG
jgi:hypothetical protein